MDIHKRTGNVLFREMTNKNQPWFAKMYGVRHLPEDKVETILDIGANVGFYSTAFRFLHPNTRIVSVEPDQRNYNSLVFNMIRLRVDTYNFALGSGKIIAETKGRNGLCNKFLENADISDTSPACQSLLLHDMIKKFSINPLGMFMKIDCEGGERCILDNSDSMSVLRLCAGFGMEAHHTLPGIPDSIGFKKMIEENLSATHDIYWYCKNRRGTYVTVYRKDLAVKSPY
jgi:FkbM family methyltransferase